MSIKISAITLDCADAIKQAEFWAALVGYNFGKNSTPEMAYILHPERKDPFMLFNLVPESKTAKNRMHVDLHVDNLEQEVERVVALGATAGESHQMDGTRWIVMTDPEGNEFCLVQEG